MDNLEQTSEALEAAATQTSSKELEDLATQADLLMASVRALFVRELMSQDTVSPKGKGGPGEGVSDTGVSGEGSPDRLSSVRKPPSSRLH